MERDKMRALLDISMEAVDYIRNVVECGKDDPAVSELLDHLRRIAALIETKTQKAAGLLQKVHLYARNVQASMDEIQRDSTTFQRIFLLEIRPFVLEMNRLWRITAEVLSDAESRAHYRTELMQAMCDLHDAPRAAYPYDVSIVLCAYNKLEYTKAAVESIFAHTDFSSGRVELITINNGSDDGTREYFECLPHAKKINLTYNIPGFDAAQHIAEGKYYIGYSNDVIATPHWLDHLFTAMESDPHIAFAVPTCNEEGVSNRQGIPVPYQNVLADVEKMQAFAAKHNHRNPALWEERPVLMPFLYIARMDVYRLGSPDPCYTRLEFVDDDLSTLLRRTGWRQLLLMDTFVHHFGGVTLGEGRKNTKNNAVVEMRRVYYEKWGVDAWDSRGCFPGTEDIWKWHDFCDKERVLVLEPRFGDLACDLRNVYRHAGLTPHMTAAVFDERYLLDTGYLFDETIAAAGIADAAAQTAGSYDVIAAGCYLDELPIGAVIADLERLYALLAPNGILILPVRNPGSAYELTRIMHTGMRDVYTAEGAVPRYETIPYRQLLEALYVHPLLSHYQVHSIIMESEASLAEGMKALLHPDADAPADLELSLSVRMFFLGIQKGET